MQTTQTNQTDQIDQKDETDQTNQTEGEQFKEILFDPDNGLELKDEVEQRLRASIESKERIPFEEVKKRLKL
jgi:hypothetical protein